MPQIIIPEPKNTEHKKIGIPEIMEAFGEPLTPELQALVTEANLEYIELTPAERDECIRVIVDKLMDPGIDQSGAHRLEKWEKGWGENFENLSTVEDWRAAIVPKYFDKYDIARWKQNFVKVTAPDFEYKMLGVILDWLFQKYVSNASAVYEFGCGTGHNLVRASKWNTSAKKFGFDWATVSSKIVDTLSAKGVIPNGKGGVFNFFEPDYSIKLEPDSVVYSIAALEQVGDKTGPFIEYLIANKPKLVFHVEPMAEVFDEKNLPDFLAIQYYKKRNYLWGHLDRLREYEKQGKIKIHSLRRTYLGHYLTDGYTVVVWSPV